MKNYWTMHKDAIANWFITFPLEVWHDARRLGQLARTLLEAGDATAVFRVRAMPAPYRFDAAADGSYAAFVADLLAREQVLPLDFKQPEAQVAGRVAYVAADQTVQETEVTDLGALLRTLRSEAAAYPYCVQPYPPVVVDGGAIDFRNISPNDDEMSYIAISLYTDIWLPWVKGLLEPDVVDEVGELVEPICYDNRPLAARHTPRFNQFLQTVIAQVRELGGALELDVNGSFYAAQIGEDGILLEADPPWTVYRG